MSKIKNVMSMTVILALVFFLFLGGPICTILAVNLLFSLAIPITFWTWLAAFWLSILLYTKT